MRIRRVAHIPIALVVGMFLGVLVALQVQSGRNDTSQNQLEVIPVAQEEVSGPEQLKDLINELEPGDTVWIYTNRSGESFSAIYEVTEDKP